MPMLGFKLFGKFSDGLPASRIDKVPANIYAFLHYEKMGEMSNSEAGRKAAGEIVLAMRRDLLHKTDLDYTSFQYIDVVGGK
jgi:hypothetical protein